MNRFSDAASPSSDGGIDDGLIRLSVGLEAPADLISDLDRALARV